MNQRWRLLALWLLPIGVVLLIGWQVVSNGGINGLSQESNGTTVAPRNAAVARMSYGRFLDYVEAGRVTAVDIYDGGRNATSLDVVEEAAVTHACHRSIAGSNGGAIAVLAEAVDASVAYHLPADQQHDADWQQPEGKKAPALIHEPKKFVN